MTDVTASVLMSHLTSSKNTERRKKMAKTFRKCLRFDAQSENNLKDLYEMENKISKETGRDKVSENQIVMDALALYHKVKCEGEQLKKEAAEEKRYYAQMNDKIISKYFNVLMNCLEGIVDSLQDQELYIKLLSAKNDVTYLLSTMGENRLMEEIERDEKKLEGLKHRNRKEKEQKGIFENHENKDKSESEERVFF